MQHKRIQTEQFSSHSFFFGGGEHRTPWCGAIIYHVHLVEVEPGDHGADPQRDTWRGIPATCTWYFGAFRLKTWRRLCSHIQSSQSNSRNVQYNSACVNGVILSCGSLFEAMLPPAECDNAIMPKPRTNWTHLPIWLQTCSFSLSTCSTAVFVYAFASSSASRLIKGLKTPWLSVTGAKSHLKWWKSFCLQRSLRLISGWVTPVLPLEDGSPWQRWCFLALQLPI